MHRPVVCNICGRLFLSKINVSRFNFIVKPYSTPQIFGHVCTEAYVETRLLFHQVCYTNLVSIVLYCNHVFKIKIDIDTNVWFRFTVLFQYPCHPKSKRFVISIHTVILSGLVRN